MRMLLLTTILCTSFVVRAAEQHSHGDHAGHDLGNIGKAHFATSCNEAAQKEIDRGVALIHSFWYAEAEKPSAERRPRTRSAAWPGGASPCPTSTRSGRRLPRTS